MRIGGRIAALLFFAGALGSTASRAFAEPDPFDSLDQIDRIHRQQARFLLFSSTDIWRQGGFAHGGLLWAPSGLDRDGPVLKLMFGGGIYHYISGALGNTEVRGELLAGTILPGWRFVRDTLSVTVFLGYDFQQHRLTPDDPSAGLRGRYVGARTGFESGISPPR